MPSVKVYSSILDISCQMMLKAPKDLSFLRYPGAFLSYFSQKCGDSGLRERRNALKGGSILSCLQGILKESKRIAFTEEKEKLL